MRLLLEGGQTAALLGSSGVGKSTLVNAILGEAKLPTAQVSGFRSKGRHTTTTRELIPLPGGGFLIDTPGMRELRLDVSDVEEGFPDIRALACQCRFRDCRHLSEPGCAVRQAAEAGALDARRLASYQALFAEQARRACRQKRRP